MEKKRKKCEKLKNVLLFRHFTLKIFNGGVFLPITTTPKYSTTVPNSVNDTQDFMCIKFKALLPCKHHPNVRKLPGAGSKCIPFPFPLTFMSSCQ